MLKNLDFHRLLKLVFTLIFLFSSPFYAQSDNSTTLCVSNLGDYIWHDSNVDGIQDENESGIEGVIIELYDSEMNLLDSTISDLNGIYLFSNLALGTYTVKISDKNFVSGGVFEDSANKKWYLSPKENGDESSYSVTVTLDTLENLNVDFGFFYTCMNFYKSGPDSVKAGDIISYDFRIENCGDVVLHGGVSVYDSLINPEGNHLIKNGVVEPRTVWEFSAPYVSTKDDCGELINNAWAIGHPVMPDGSKLPNVEDNDSWAVEVICDDKSTLGDRVWNDANKNGLQDLGENGIANVDVKLYGIDNVLLDSSQTDDNGFYLFEELLPGDYYIHFVQPDGYSFTVKNQGDDREVDSDTDQLTGNTDIITITSSTTDLSWDAGFYSSGQEEFDLMLEMTVNNSNPNDEENIFYTLTVTNISPVDAHNVEVTDPLPAGLDYLYTEPANYDTSTSIWSVGDVPSGSSEDLNIHVKVNYKDLSLSPPIDLGIASDYNLFVLKDVVQPSSDTEGKVAVGRDASFSNYSIGDKLPPSGGTEDVLIVGRKLTFTSGIVFGGNVVYGEFIDIPQYAVSVVDGTIRQENPVPIDFDQAETELLSVSSQLANKEVNGTVESQWGGLILTGTAPMFNVFEVDGELISNSNNMTITVPSGAVVIVNITGETISWSGGLSVSGTDISNVLYNFNDATDLTISGIDIRGSLLAPKAHVNFVAGVINGQMLCQYFEGRGQMNNTKFRGYIPGNPEITNCAEITYSEPTDTNKSNNSACVTININVNPDPNDGTGDEVWEEVNISGLTEMIWSMYQSSDGLLLGTVGGNIYQNTTSGWNLLNDEMNVGFIWSMLEYNGIIYAGTDQGLYKYDGSNWVAMELSGDVRAILILNNTLYATVWGSGVFYSNDEGQTWNAMNEGLIYYSTQPLIVVGDDLFVGIFGQGVLKYDFENSTWIELPIQCKYIWTLTADANGNIYAGTSGSGVYVSKDGGNNWTQINTGLPDQYIYLLATYDNEIYAATWFGGIYKLSESDGSTNFWQNIGMSGIQVSSMYIDKSSGTLFTGTSYGTVYKLVENTVSVQTVEKIPTEYSLSQNYPNPFNPSTIIKYSIPSVATGHTLSVRLVIYDILGREVTTLVNEQQKPGYYEVNWDASNMPSGIYFYQIRICSNANNNFVRTNKMILMK